MLSTPNARIDIGSLDLGLIVVEHRHLRHEIECGITDSQRIQIRYASIGRRIPTTGIRNDRTLAQPLQKPSTATDRLVSEFGSKDRN